MKREQAEEIVDYLVAAARELDEARAAAAVLEADDTDAASLNALLIRINSELIEVIFDRFADLIPFQEFPEISSALDWDQVRLPPSISVAQIDEIILSVISPRWLKMARIVWDAVKRSKELGLEVTDEIFAARIRTLVDAERVDGQGDLRIWRFSEVRLKTLMS